jgi:hypothetical protein
MIKRSTGFAAATAWASAIRSAKDGWPSAQRLY